MHFMMGEVLAVQGSELQAVREFRRVSDETPSDPLAPQALLRAGDAYAKLWRKPQLDPTYGQTALSTFQELVSRYPGTRAAQQGQVRLNELQDDFAYKGYRTGLYYDRIKAYDSCHPLPARRGGHLSAGDHRAGGPGAAGQGVPGAGL